MIIVTNGMGLVIDWVKINFDMVCGVSNFLENGPDLIKMFHIMD